MKYWCEHPWRTKVRQCPRGGLREVRTAHRRALRRHRHGDRAPPERPGDPHAAARATGRDHERPPRDRQARRLRGGRPRARRRHEEGTARRAEGVAASAWRQRRRSNPIEADGVAGRRSAMARPSRTARPATRPPGPSCSRAGRSPRSAASPPWKSSPAIAASSWPRFRATRPVAGGETKSAATNRGVAWPQPRPPADGAFAGRARLAGEADPLGKRTAATAVDALEGRSPLLACSVVGRSSLGPGRPLIARCSFRHKPIYSYTYMII